MSDEEKSEIIQIIDAGKKLDRKFNFVKIAIALGSLFSFLCTFVWAVFYLGSIKGDWYNWRSDVDKDRTEFRNHLNDNQAEQNRKRAAYNQSINPKTADK